MAARARAVVREHRALAVLVALGVLVRVAAWIAYRPALLYSDSWSYLDLAYHGTPVGISPTRPIGYPLVLRALSFAGRHLALVTAVQHLAGLVTGVLAYAIVRRLEPRRWVAVAVGGVVLLDAYAIALEQRILTETLFALTLTLAAFLTVGAASGERGGVAGGERRRLAAAGLCLAAAVALRTSGVFALPVWAAYLLWARVDRRSLAVAALACALPLLGYASLHAAKTGQFGFTTANGWFLYGRIGEIADCRGSRIPPETRSLCTGLPVPQPEGATFYIWDPRSPAQRLFGGPPGGPRARLERSNALLRRFAVATMRERPGAYLKLVAGDFARFFTPGVMERGDRDVVTVSFPPPAGVAEGGDVDRFERARTFPSYVPRARPPEALLRAYWHVVHVPRWLLGLLALASLAAVAARAPRRRETFLLSGTALTILAGTAAGGEFTVRYLVPVVPLLLCGGAAAAADLAALVVARRRRAALGAVGG